MKSQVTLMCLATCFGHNVTYSATLQERGTNANEKEKTAAFSFADVKYFHRYSIDEQHEYTPAGQEDPKVWTDMVTINYYLKVKDGEALAKTANAVLASYKTNKAAIVKIGSVPRTKDKEAEHVIIVSFARPKFHEAVFARLRMHDGVGTAVIYSHRIYGKDIESQMATWLEKNSARIEKGLMKWDDMPKPTAPK
jgi:hypothetical protein